jgi:oxygen-independent coproporphyrinogen-3 oxidase
MQGKLFAGMNRVEQLHFGGGTPTYFSDAQMGELMAHLRRNFEFAPDDGRRILDRDRSAHGRCAAHPALRARVSTASAWACRTSIPRCRRPSTASSRRPIPIAMHERRARGRLPFGQHRPDLWPAEADHADHGATLSKVIRADPDRIALYNYAHMPHLFKPQRRIDDEDMPAPAAKLDMLALCISRLTAAGYVYIGMDHFAKPDDDLAVAQRQGRLHRNFQGYSTHAETDLVACGVSAISAVNGTYSQNVKTLDAYYDPARPATSCRSRAAPPRRTTCCAGWSSTP